MQNLTPFMAIAFIGGKNRHCWVSKFPSNRLPSSHPLAVEKLWWWAPGGWFEIKISRLSNPVIAPCYIPLMIK